MSRVFTTSVNYRHIRSVLWQEIKKLYGTLAKKISNPGEVFQTEIRIQDGWHAMGLSSDKPEGFQGYHEEHLLIIVDEACGIPMETFDAIQTCAASPKNKILLIGNPTDPNTFFGYTHSGKVKGWKTVRMSAFESPNIYLGPDGEWHDKDPLPYPKLVSTKWINEKKADWGDRDPRYISRVLGRFPESAENQLISGRWIAQGIERGIILRRVYEEMEEGSMVLGSNEVAALLKGGSIGGQV
jgi:hypothetical protein